MAYYIAALATMIKVGISFLWPQELLSCVRCHRFLIVVGTTSYECCLFVGKNF